MKKSFVLSVILAISIASSCFAIGAGIGVRAMGMGGCGIATANDITSAYFNPAGLMYGPENFEFSTYASDILGTITRVGDAVSDTGGFIEKNFEQDVSFGGTIAGGFGMSVNKVGISVIADALGNFNKPAFDKPTPAAINFNLIGKGNLMIPLTLGSTFTTPGLPIASMSVGVNLKSIYIASVITDVTAANGTSSTMLGSGFGFDIGAMAKLTPLINLGAVVRNLSASTNVTKKTDTIAVTPNPDGSATVTTTAGPEEKTTYNLPPEVGIGVGISNPLTGTLVAIDLENYSAPDPDHPSQSCSYTDTHIGIEQGVLFNIIMLRLGYFSYSPNSDNFYTYGLGLNLGPCNIGVSAANSAKDSKDSSAMAQVGIAF